MESTFDMKLVLIAIFKNPSGSSKVDGLSPFQVDRIYLETFLQYFLGLWVPAPSSYLYRSRNSAPER